MKNLQNIIKYLSYWPAFLLSICVCLSLALLYLWYVPAKYQVSSTLLIQDDIKGEGMLKATAFSDLQMFKTSKTVSNEMEVLRSRDLIYKVLKSLPLETSYSKKKLVKTIELYGNELPIEVNIITLHPGAYLKQPSIKVLDSSCFLLQDNEKKTIYRFGQLIQNADYKIKVVKGPSFAANSEPIFIKFNDIHKMAESYSLTGLNITPIVKDANTIVLSLLDAVPQRGVDILNKLIETYNIENVDNKNTIARNTISFIDSRLKYLSSDLTSVELDVENYKQQNMVTDIGTNAQMHLNSSENYNQQLAASELQLSIINSIEFYLNKPDKNFDLVPSTLGLKDPTFNILTERYNGLQLERQRLLTNARASNPLIIDVNDQLANLKLSMQENLKNIKRGLILERNNLRSKFVQFESKIKAVPALERGLLERSREQNVKLSLYHYLLQKREETALSLTATVPTSQVIDKPAYNTIPEEPKDSLIYLISSLFGIMLPMGVIYCREKLNNKVHDVSEIKLITGAKVLGELSNKGRLGSVVVQKDSRTTISELFRYIRSNLNYINNTDQNQVLLVTSSIQGEGKTFFSINLGLTLSLTDKKVVLLEFDLRKPDLLKSIQVESPIGITDYLTSNSIDLDDIISPSGLSSNLSVIGCGKMPDNPSEMFLSQRLQVLFYKLRERFDYVIIDTSPVGQVADAFSLAEYSDSSIYLVRYNFTNKYQLRILEDVYENRKLKNPLVVLNDAKEENRNVYGYGRYSYA